MVTKPRDKCTLMVRWPAPSTDFNEKFDKRLNQPMGMDIRCHRLEICPFRIYEEHDVNFGPEWDWYVPDNAPAWYERVRMMHARNLVIKEQLQRGNPVQFRVWGLSMYPLVHKGDCCLFEPVVYVSRLRIGDIIFCQLDIGSRFFAHKISGITIPAASAPTAEDEDFRTGETYTISAQNGKCVGFCKGHTIYGRLVEVSFL